MSDSEDEGPARLDRIAITPIGVVRSSYREKREAPRQGVLAGGARVELEPGRGLEHAVEGLEGFSRVWILSWMDRAAREGPGPNKVSPPRSARRQGVLATRSPHRPNPIGLTSARLLAVEGLTLRLAEVDLLDGTPVLDVKPYLPYADAFPDETSGWLERPSDPVAPVPVALDPAAEEQLRFLGALGVPLEAELRAALALGGEPKPYRRIRLRGPFRELSVKDWRVDFVVDEGGVRVLRVRSGHRPRDLAAGPTGALAAHAAFAARFPG